VIAALVLGNDAVRGSARCKSWGRYHKFCDNPEIASGRGDGDTGIAPGVGELGALEACAARWAGRGDRHGRGDDGDRVVSLALVNELDPDASTRARTDTAVTVVGMTARGHRGGQGDRGGSTLAAL